MIYYSIITGHFKFDIITTMRKREVILLLISLSLFNSGLSQPTTHDEVVKGTLLFADSIKWETDIHINRIKRTIDLSNKGSADLGLQYYNLAICYSAKKQIDSACYFLFQVIDHYSEYNNLVYTDTDLDSLRQTPCWNTITQKIDSAYLAKYPRITQRELAIELYHIYLMDQHARGLGLKKNDERLKNIDILNLKRIEEIIQMYGWPTYSMVGETAAKGAFMVIQHSNIQIQQKYFVLIMDAAKKNEASKEWIALLMDRVSIQKKGVQIFGTQVYLVQGSLNNQKPIYKYFPIQDEANVDSLRKEFGMIPLNEYYSLFGIDYKPVQK